MYPPKNRRVTLSDIAAYTGLSKPTVTRILGKDAHLFNEETCRKVLDAAKKLGYRPNSAARIISRGSFGGVGLLLGLQEATSFLPIDLLHGIHDALAKKDYYLCLTKLSDEQLTSPNFFPRLLKEVLVDALLVHYTYHIPEKMEAILASQPLPVVWLNVVKSQDCVCPDDYQGLYQLTTSIIQLGHRRIVYFNTSPSPHYSTQERRQGYEDAMLQAKLYPCSIVKTWEGAAFGDYIKHLLEQPDRPTALILRPEDLPTVSYVAGALGFLIPQDLSLAICTHRTVEICGKKVTAALVPDYLMGLQAVAQIINKIQNPSFSAPLQRVPFSFEPGETLIPLS